MINSNSKFINNTKRDLIGEVTAIVFISVLLEYGPIDTGCFLDKEVDAFLTKKSREIEKLVQATLAVAMAFDIKSEVIETVGDLVPREMGYYDAKTINALLSLYLGERRLKDLSTVDKMEFLGICKKTLQKKWRTWLVPHFGVASNRTNKDCRHPVLTFLKSMYQ